MAMAAKLADSGGGPSAGMRPESLSVKLDAELRSVTSLRACGFLLRYAASILICSSMWSCCSRCLAEADNDVNLFLSQSSRPKVDSTLDMLVPIIAHVVPNILVAINILVQEICKVQPPIASNQQLHLSCIMRFSNTQTLVKPKCQRTATHVLTWLDAKHKT